MKYVFFTPFTPFTPSLRSSERGLKSGYLEVSFDVLQSLRSSERGLKSISPAMSDNLPLVAPFVGAWIEITVGGKASYSLECRSVRRSVD